MSRLHAGMIVGSRDGPDSFVIIARSGTTYRVSAGGFVRVNTVHREWYERTPHHQGDRAGIILDTSWRRWVRNHVRNPERAIAKITELVNKRKDFLFDI